MAPLGTVGCTQRTCGGRSRPAGGHWKFLGLADTRQIGRILVDPRNPAVVFVAALGHAYGANEERGVFRSKDGGEHWSKVLFENPDTGAIDLAFRPLPDASGSPSLRAAPTGSMHSSTARAMRAACTARMTGDAVDGADADRLYHLPGATPGNRF